MNRRIVMSLLGTALLAAAPSFAADGRTSVDEDFSRPRVYFGLGPLWALTNFHTGASALTGGSGARVDADDTYGADGRIGYRVHPNIALEAQGQFFGEADLEARLPGQTASQRIGRIQAVSATGNFKLYPITGRVQPYALGGLGLMWAHQENSLPNAKRGNNTELAGRGGVGVDVYLDENFAVNVEGSYLVPASSLRHLPLAAMSAGIQYHF
jgi:opacity protein-like surface antigen